MISIIIPVYNAEKFLEQTVNSVLEQTYSDFELLLVNDGSADKSWAVMEKLKAGDSRIHILNKENGGLSDARNMGYQNAKGNYILFLDHDDIFAPRMLEDMIKAIQKSDLVYVCAQDQTDSAVNTWQWQLKDYDSIVEVFSGKEIFEKLFCRDEYMGIKGALWGMLIPREFLTKMEPEIYKEQNRLPITYFEDVHLTYRFFWNASKVMLLNQTYVVHRVSEHALSRKLEPSEYGYELLTAAVLKQQFLKENGLTELYQEQLIPFFMTVLKVWWQVDSYEKNDSQKEKIKKEVAIVNQEYYIDIKKRKSKTIGDRIIKTTIALFQISPFLWKLCVGNPWFKIKYRLEMK